MRVSNMVQAVDAHACGEHGRVIVGGVLDVPGATMFDKMCHLRDHADGLRKRMLREPRGYPAANCNLILPSSHPEADAGLRDHGAGRVSRHVGHEHHLRDDRAARDRNAADAGAGHGAHARSARGTHSRSGRLRERQGQARDVSQRARVRRVSRHADRSAAPRHGDGRRRLRRHVLRHRRRHAVRSAPHARRGRATSSASAR